MAAAGDRWLCNRSLGLWNGDFPLVRELAGAEFTLH